MSRNALIRQAKRLCVRIFGTCAAVFALSIGVAAIAAPGNAYADALDDGTYIPAGLSTEVFNMYHFDAAESRVVIRGDEAWLITGPSDSKTLDRYDGMAYGSQSEILDFSDSTNHTLVAGTPVANVLETYGADGATVTSRTFVLPVPKWVFETGSDIYYMMKYRNGYNATHDGDWYVAGGGDYYLTGYTLVYESDSTVLPGEDPAPIVDDLELEVTNAASDLEVTQAFITSDGEGNVTLVVDLVGDNAGWLYDGTLAQALATGSTDEGWYAGEAQDDGSMRFFIPILSVTDYVPFSLVASSTLDVEANVHPYQFILDINAAALRLERYDNVFNIAVAVDDAVAPDFSAASTGTVRVIGGPNDDVFKIAATVYMDDEAHDYIEYGSVLDGEAIRAGTALSEGSFFLVFENSAGKTSFALGQPSAVSIHHADSDLWLDRTMTIDLAAETIRIGGTDEGEAVAKALIEALPRDPITIRNDSDGRIAKAAAAYDALPADVQARLDEEKPPFETTPYGRILENAQWAVEAMKSASSSTTLPDGVYTTGIQSTSSMGKSQSSRSKGFKVKSVTVRDGIAIATLEHESTTDGIVHINGREYANNKPAKGSDYRTYDVPIDLNSTFHIVWKAQDAGSSVTGMSYEMTNTIDETRKKPDSALPSEDSSSGSSSSDSKTIRDLIKVITKLLAQQQASGGSGASGNKPTGVNANASTSSNNAALSAAAASRTGTSGSANSDKEPVATKTSKDSGGSGGTGGVGITGAADSADAPTTLGANQWDTRDTSIAIGAVLLAIAALGILGFTLRFVRREKIFRS